ncbi:MAG: DUF2089 domain-containing protein [Anaerolineales bacterium]|nr:DUF2089 domain-containing protein [Anaerolineales bacterium]
MQPVPNRCPLCGGELTVTRIYCRSCDTAYEGRFSSSLFSNLTQDQLNFMVTFVRCEGKISRVGEEIGLSYPTIRNRLHEVIRALGYEPGGDDEPPGLHRRGTAAHPGGPGQRGDQRRRSHAPFARSGGLRWRAKQSRPA